MTTTSSVPRRRSPRGGDSLVALTASRAVVAAVLAAVVTFTDYHGPLFGLIVLGAFSVVFGVVTAVGVRALPPLRSSRLLAGARAAVLIVGGIVALVLAHGGLVTLVTVQAAIFLAAGALEVVSGVRRDGAREIAGDAIVVGGLQVIVGFLLVVLDRDAVFTVGVLGAWGAVVAVYLGIAAVSLRRQEAGA